MKDYTEYITILDRVFKKQSAKSIFKIMNTKGNIRDITYGEVYSDVLRFRQISKNMGLRPGDRILLLDNHTPSVLRMFLAAGYCNLTPVMMDAGLPASEINFLIDTLKLSAVFTNLKLCEKLSDTVKNEIPIYDIRDSGHDYPALYKPIHSYLSERFRDGNPKIAVIVMSSGTTSRIKAAEISYTGFLNSINQNTRISGIRRTDNMLLVFPLFHVSGLYSAMTILLKGNTLMMMDEFHPSELSKALHTFNPQAFGMVPKVFELMVQKFHQELGKKNVFIRMYYEFSFKTASFFNRKFGISAVGRIMMRPFAVALFGKNIRVLPVGASRCSPETAETMINMGLRWFYVYASTECGVPITSVTESDHYPCDTVGRVDSVENVDIMIKNPDIYGTGEIYVKTSQIMDGYFQDPKLTAESFSDGYFKTGDLGYVDRKGYLHLTGRSKETILLQTGKKVSPADLEDLLKHAGFTYEAAICGVPDADTGFDRIHVFICGDITSETEKEKCREDVRKIFMEEASHYPVDRIHFVTGLPKTAIGKVRRNLLRDMVLPEISAQPEEIKNGVKEESDTVSCGLSTDADLGNFLLSMFNMDSDDEITGFDMNWKEYGNIDSLQVMEIMADIEKKTGIYIGEDIIKLDTVNDILNYIREKQHGKS